MTATMTTADDMTTDEAPTTAPLRMGYGGDTLHVTVNRKAFLETFGKASKVSPSSSPKPILTGIKLTANDDSVTLISTDLEIGARLRVHGVTVHTPGSAILPTARFSAILAKSNDAELDIRIEGDHLVVRGTRSRFELPTEDPTLFPEVPSFDADAYHVIAAGDMRKLIRRTIASTDVLSTRYALGGCMMELSEDSVSMVATDGRRLAKMTAPAEAENGAAPPDGSPVIPVKGLKVIDASLDDPDLSVHVAFVNGSAVLVRTSDESSVVYCRLVAGRFPRYQDVYPDLVSAVKIPTDVAPFREAVEQASIVTSDESRGVRFSWSDGKLALTSQAADVGSSEIEVPVDYEGAEVFAVFDPRYLSDCLKNIPDDSEFSVSILDHKNAALFRTADGFDYIVMPLSVDR